MELCGSPKLLGRLQNQLEELDRPQRERIKRPFKNSLGQLRNINIQYIQITATTDIMSIFQMIQKTILPAKGKTQLIVIALEMEKNLCHFGPRIGLMLTLTLKNDVIADPLRPCKTRYKNQRQMMRHAIMSNEKSITPIFIKSILTDRQSDVPTDLWTNRLMI